MRKLLLATVAVLGAGIGIAETAQAQDFPTPGTVTVRLNGRFRFYAGIMNTSDANNNLQGSANGVTPLTGTNKLADYGDGAYGRLFPGFDGVAANGLKYGASMEIRSQTGSGAGFGIYGGTGQQTSARNQLYFYRQWGYIGTDKLGTIRLGETDAPTSLYATGTFENFNDGAWDGDAPSFLPGNLVPAFPFLDYGQLIPINRGVYLSPQIFGFDFGASFAPNTGGGGFGSNCGTGGPNGTNFVTPGGALQATLPGTSNLITANGTGINGGTGTTATVIGAAGANGQSIAGPGCDALAATPTGDYSRPRNIFDVLLRYRGSFGAFGIAATGAYLGSGTVAGNATPHQSPSYNGYSVGDFGLAITYGGLSFGGHYTFGQMNGGSENLNPTNGKPMSGWLAGASYTIGPVIVGASYFVDDSTGDITQASQGRLLHEVGLAAGGTYSVAPGLAIFLSYLYGERRQNGVNLITGVDGDPNHNKVTASVISIGTSLAW